MAEAASCAQMLLFGTNPCNTDCWCTVMFIGKCFVFDGSCAARREFKKGMEKGKAKREWKKAYRIGGDRVGHS